VALCGASATWGASDSVVVESKTVVPGATDVQIHVRIVNSVLLGRLAVPLEIRAVTPGAFITSLSMSFQERLTTYMTDYGSTWQYAIADGVSCKYASPTFLDGAKHPVSGVPEEEAVKFERGVLVNPAIALPPGPDAAGSVLLTVDVTATPGTFTIDTTCMDPTAPANHLLFEEFLGTAVPVVFTKGFITIFAPVSDTVHVDTTGNDLSGDGTRATPFQTIQKAMSLVPPNKTILVGPGTYSGPVIFPFDRTVRLVSEGGPFLTMITGSNGSSRSAVVMRALSLVDFQEVNGFTISFNATAAGCTECTGGIHVEYPSTAIIVNNVILGNLGHNATGGIAFYGTGGLVANNWIVGNGGTGSGSAGGLWLRDDVSVKVVNNTIVNNANDGAPAAGIWVEDIDVNGHSDLVYVDNNIIALNYPGDGYKGMPLGVSAVMRNNLYFNNGDGNAYPPGVPSANWVFTDPLFRDYASGDYHLACLSPARNAGRAASVPADVIYDIDGQLRSAGFPPQVDIGADQFYDADKKAIFFPQDTTVCAPFTATFINRSTCVDENWWWGFGDGDTSIVKDPIHVFSAPGDYSVRLIAWGELDADTAYSTIHVAPPLSVDFAADVDSGCAPLAVTFTGAASAIADKYRWDFGDGDRDSSGAVVTHTYSSGGTYMVTLVASNACGADTVIKTDFVEVKAPPVVEIYSDYNPPAGVPVCNPFTVQFWYTSDQSISAVRWDFGDDASSSDSAPSHTYDTANTSGFSVQLIATAECGSVSVVKQHYIKLAPRPVATPSAGAAFACAGQTTVDFSATVTGTISSPRWLFGDGTSADGLTARHVYDTVGRILPAIIYAHICGTDTVPLSDSIAVGARPEAAFAVVPDSGYEPLIAAFTDSSTNLPTSWAWSFGDNGTSSQQNPTHSYAPGVFDAGLIAQNPCGADTTALKRIVVGGFAPAILDSLGTAGDTILFSVKVDTLVIPYDHAVTLSGRLTASPRRGAMSVVFSPSSGVPPFAAVMKAIPTRDLATRDYIIEFKVTDSSRTDDLQIPISKTATWGLHFTGRPLLRIEPAPLSLDSTPVGFPISKNLVVSNTATLAEGFTIIVQPPLPSGPPFAVPTGAGATLGPQQHLTWAAQFAPLRKGNFTGYIRVRSDDPGSPDTLITVTGRGIGEQTPPKVALTQPVDEAELAIDEMVRIEFSKPMAVAPLDTIFFVRSARSDTLVPGQTRFTSLTLDFLPEDWFLPDDTITVLLRAAVTDTDGNRLDGNRDGIEDGPPVDDFHLVFTTGPGVYPGDADCSGGVDEADLLPLGRFWGLTGAARPRQYSGFTLQPALSWTPRAATHADADGNGRIDSADICPIAEFFTRDTALSKVRVESWLAEAKVWSAGIVHALIAALADCPGEPAGRETLRRLLEQTQTADRDRVPRDFALEQNYPNPFNAATVITYALPRNTEVHLEVFDILGRCVAVLVTGEQEPGRYQVIWDGRDDGGRTVASGIYFYRLATPGFRQVRKMVLVK
jgi:PKD repeat protein